MLSDTKCWNQIYISQQLSNIVSALNQKPQNDCLDWCLWHKWSLFTKRVLVVLCCWDSHFSEEVAEIIVNKHNWRDQDNAKKPNKAYLWLNSLLEASQPQAGAVSYPPTTRANRKDAL